MNKVEAQRIVRREYPRYQKMFHLQDWKINFKYGWIGGEDAETYGECRTDPSYSIARISINHDIHKEEKELVHTLRHEMLHILHASFDIYQDTVEKLIEGKEFDALETVYSFAVEDAVQKLEAIFDKELKIPMLKTKKTTKKKRKKK